MKRTMQGQVSPEVDNPPDISKNSTGSGRFSLQWSLLAYCGSLTLLITMAPFRFRLPSVVEYIWLDGWFDALTNVVLFLPLGFLYRLTRESVLKASLARVFWLGFVISAAIETTQIFLPGRYPSPVDLATNAFGAWLGGLLCDWAQTRLDRQWIGRLGLELPLMNIVYLLIPLVWIDGLASAGEPNRGHLAWLLGLTGSIVIAGVYRYGLKSPQAIERGALVAAAGFWFFAGSLPALFESASTTYFGVAVAVITAYVSARLPVFGNVSQRRFEIPVLKRVFPIYGAYLLLLFLWPIPTAYTPWRGAWGLAELADDPAIGPMLGLIELFTAFTLLGYMIAESHGRRDVSRSTSMMWSCFWCGFAAALLEGLRGFHPAHVASFAGFLLTFTGSAFGASIYWRQLASIQTLQEPAADLSGQRLDEARYEPSVS